MQAALDSPPCRATVLAARIVPDNQHGDSTMPDETLGSRIFQVTVTKDTAVPWVIREG
jgi:hypothetical protein